MKKVYFENLDGLRFFSFLSVFLFHSFHTEYDYISDASMYSFVSRDIFGNGNLGVNFFFVLSGFLITYLLIEEKKLNGQINIPKFWIRRILRIWPLFYFSVFFGFVIFPILKELFGQVPNETADPIYYLFFINNFNFISEGLPDASVLGVLWSIAVEEQFYFLWPLILFIFPIRLYWLPFALIIAISLVFRGMFDSYTMHEYHTLSCISDMTIGALGAWLISEKRGLKQQVVNLSKSQIIAIYLLLLLVFLFRDEVLFSNYIIRIFERLFISIIILAVILEQNYSKNSLFKLSKLKTISKLGIITYGLYCLQFIGILSTTTVSRLLGLNTSLWQVLLLETSIALSVTIILARLSYIYFESPFLKLKKRFAYFSMN